MIFIHLSHLTHLFWHLLFTYLPLPHFVMSVKLQKWIFLLFVLLSASISFLLVCIKVLHTLLTRRRATAKFGLIGRPSVQQGVYVYSLVYIIIKAAAEPASHTVRQLLFWKTLVSVYRHNILRNITIFYLFCMHGYKMRILHFFRTVIIKVIDKIVNYKYSCWCCETKVFNQDFYPPLCKYKAKLSFMNK